MERTGNKQKKSVPVAKQLPLKKKDLNKQSRFVNQEESKEPTARVASAGIKKKATTGFNLAAIAPTNVVEQQELFFKNDCKIDPQFEYANYAATQKSMQSQTKPKDEHLALAVKILDSFLEVYGCESVYLKSEGDILSQEEVERYIRNYIEEIGCNDLINIKFSKKQVAPTSVTKDTKTGKSNINVALPC